MEKSIKGTRTEQNLLKAFAGESQARIRYVFFSSKAKKEGYEQIAGVFAETAEQEKEHAERFFKFLEGGDVEITASYPTGPIGTTAENLLAAAKEKGEPPFLVLSDGIEDPHNLGAVMRSALLCGAHGIVIPKRGGASVTPTVIKSSAGAAERLPVARVANIGETIRRLKEQGVFVYCADMDGVSLRRNNLTGPIALVLGSEGSGVSQLVKKLCDGVVSLDMAARGTGVDSFNVSVAAGIILYEIQSQRAAQG